MQGQGSNEKGAVDIGEPAVSPKSKVPSKNMLPRWVAAALFAVLFLIISWQSWSFIDAVRESQSERIQVFHYLNDLEKSTAGYKAEFSAIRSQLKELSVLSQKLRVSEVKVTVLEKQLNEQKDTIASLVAANQELSNRLDSMQKK